MKIFALVKHDRKIKEIEVEALNEHAAREELAKKGMIILKIIEGASNLFESKMPPENLNELNAPSATVQPRKNRSHLLNNKYTVLDDRFNNRILVCAKEKVVSGRFSFVIQYCPSDNNNRGIFILETCETAAPSSFHSISGQIQIWSDVHGSRSYPYTNISYEVVFLTSREVGSYFIPGNQVDMIAQSNRIAIQVTGTQGQMNSVDPHSANTILHFIKELSTVSLDEIQLLPKSDLVNYKESKSRGLNGSNMNIGCGAIFLIISIPLFFIPFIGWIAGIIFMVIGFMIVVKPR